MNRLLRIAAAVPLALLLVAPAALAAEPELAHTGRVMIVTEDDVTVPAGEQADLVVVVRGTATIAGTVNTVVAVEGSAVLTGATTETVVAVRSPVVVGGGTVVRGDVLTVDSRVDTQGGTIQGRTRDLATDIAGLGFVLAPVFLLLWLGFAIAAIAAALLVAGLAARQVREAEAIISREPLLSFGVGLLGIILPIVVVAILFVTIVGAPLAFGILFGLWPFAGFVGYVVAAIWIGDWLLVRLANRQPEERPYLAAIVGIVALQLLGIWPFLPGIAGLIGFGAVLLLAWRVFRGEDRVRALRPTGPSAPLAS